MNHAKSQVTKFSGLYRRSQFASTPASSNALISEYMQKSAMQLRITICSPQKTLTFNLTKDFLNEQNAFTHPIDKEELHPL